MKIFRTVFSVFLALVLTLSLLPLTALAATSGDYEYSVNGGYAIITKYIGSAANLSIPETLGGYPVTAIWNGAFYNCSTLENVTIPNSVMSIGDKAFEYCSSLTSITIPSSVISIGDKAFESCSSLTSIMIPSSVTSIGDKAFSKCSSLTSITIPNSMTRIGNDAFSYCTSLTSITIPTSVKSIGGYAFSYCTSLTSITIPNSVTSIGSGAFEYCSSLTSITIPSSVTSIVSWAFRGCSSLTSITIPNSVTSIGSGAFEHCSGLTSITIPSSVTSIGGTAFAGCSSLTSITVPNSVTSIGTWAFSNCSSLTSITIPSSVTSIGTWTFSGCGSLTSITIPSSVTSIGTCAFIECTSLTSAYFYGNAPSMGSEVFYICAPGFTVYYIPGKTGWTTPTWNGYNTAAWSGNTADVSSVMVDGKNVLAEKVTYAKPGTTNSVSVSANWNENKPGLYQLVQNNSTKYTSLSGSFSLNIANTLTAGADVYLRLVNSTGATVKTIKTGIVVAGQNIGSEISEKLGTFKSLPGDDKASDRTYDYKYSDSYFKGDSYTYKHDLAKMSLNLALAAFNAKNSKDSGYSQYYAGSHIRNLLKEIGFEKETLKSDLYGGAPEQNSIGVAFGKKTIEQNGEKYTLIAVAIRGGGYEKEWAGNFTIDGSTDHTGFSIAASKVKGALSEYILDAKDPITGKIKIWITGYSRAAAVANLVAAALDDGCLGSATTYSLQPRDIYAYTFETPQNTKSTQAGAPEYLNIFNIVNPIDPVPKVAMSAWGYSRYGVNLCLPSAETSSQNYKSAKGQVASKYREITGDALPLQIPSQGAILDTFMNVFAFMLGNENTIQAKKLLYETRKLILHGLDIGDMALLSGAITELSKLPGAIPTALIIAGGALIVVKAHYPELCYAWVNTLTGIEGYASDKYRELKINCPVDVHVYDSDNNLVASVIDHVVQEIPDSSIGAYVDDNDEIHVILPPDEKYHIEVTATDDGFVDYSIGEYSLENAAYNRVVNYYDIPISEGDVLNGTAPNIESVFMRSMSGSNNYQLTALEGDVIPPSIDLSGGQIEHFSVAVTVEGNGAVTGAGQVLVGDYVTLTATPNGSDTFIGWYDKADNLLSTDSEYRFRIESDISITAKFTGVLVIPEIYDIWTSGVDYDARQAVTGALDFTLSLINAGTMDISSVDVTVVGDHLGEVYNETLPCSLGAESYGELEISIDIPQLESAENYTIAVNPNSNVNDSANNIVDFTLGEFDIVITSSDYLDQGVYMSDVTVTNFGSKTNAILRVYADDEDGDVLFEQSLGNMAMGDNQSLTIDLDGLVSGVDVSALYAVVSSPEQSESRSGDNVTILAYFVPAVTNEDSYTLTVTGGIGSGDYAEDVVVIIVADEAPSGQQFKQWNISPSVTFADGTNAASATAKFTMPNQAVTATSVYEPIPPTTYAVTVTNGTGGGNYAAGAEVTVAANTAPSGQQFKQWNISPSVTFTSGTSAVSTTAKFMMPNQAVTATSVYEPIPPTTIAVTSVGLSPTSASLRVGQTQQLTTTVFPANATNKAVTYSSSNKNVTTVSIAGLVTAKGVGTATITVKTNDGNKTATCSIMVAAPIVGSYQPGKLPTKAFKETAVTVQRVAGAVSQTMSSSNNKVITVNGDKLEFVGAGKAKVTVKYQLVNAKTGKIATKTVNKTITVTSKVKGISLNKTSATIAKKGKVTLTASISPSDATTKTVTWSTSNKKVATVTSKGVVAGKGAGTCTITAKTKDGGYTARAVITVTPIYETAIKLNKTSARLNKGKTLQLKASLTPSSTDFKTVTWTSDNPNVAKVNAKGKVTAVQTGTCTITATSANGKTAICRITTLPQKVTSVKMGKVATTQFAGNTVKIPLTVGPVTADNRVVTWTSSNSNIATVHQDGTVTLHAGGKVTIKAIAQDGSKKSASKTFTVKQPVSGISLNKTSATIAKKSKVTLTASISPSNATTKTVTWSTSNKKVATVTSKGVVAGIGAGTCTITAKTKDGGYTARAVITVTPIYETAIKLNKTSARLNKGKTLQLKASLTPSSTDFKTVTWTSDNPNVAKVNAKGKVTAVQTGTCTITARSANGKTAICRITTLPQKVTSVKMGKVATTQFAGNTVKIPLTVGPVTADNRAVTWTSSNSNIATVHQDGNVTFHAGGKVTIKAIAQDGSKKSASKTFTVKQPVSGISLNKTSATIAKKGKVTLTASISPSNATTKIVTWSTSNKKVATVTSKGVVKGVSRGTVIITCRAKDGSGIIAQCTVIVN